MKYILPFSKLGFFLLCVTLTASSLIYHCASDRLPVLGQPHIPSDIVIDIGHGGNDPGKVGINSGLEKDINLAVGLCLKEYLSAAGYRVTLTRETDVSLADTDASNQKLSDFHNRTRFINDQAPSAVISIHQNSYPQETVKGTQVFHSGSTESAYLASCIQEQCRRILDPDNHRQIKKNTDYYLFRHVTSPIVIVECGFLSNYKEANLLITEDYQQKIAWAISMGTIQFLQSVN